MENTRKKLSQVLAVVLCLLFLTMCCLPQAAEAKSKNSSSSSSSTPSYTYNSVDFTADCISNNEIDITVETSVSMKNNLCWWVNYRNSAVKPFALAMGSVNTQTTSNVAMCAGIATSVSSSVGSAVASSVASSASTSGGSSGGGGGGGGGCR